jgi:hypothetical protein
MENLVNNEINHDREEKHKDFLVKEINIVDDSDLVHKIIFGMMGCDFKNNMDIIKQFLFELYKINFVK